MSGGRTVVGSSRAAHRGAMLRSVQLYIEVLEALQPIVTADEHMDQLFLNQSTMPTHMPSQYPEGAVSLSPKEGVDRVVGELRDAGRRMAPDHMPRILAES